MEDTFNNVRLTNEDLVYLYQKNNDPDAMSEVILRNQGAIYQCIKEAGSKGMYSVGFDAEDAYQTACLAMMTSAKKYKPGINVKYITYSWGYIYRYIMNESAEAKFSIRIPRNIYN
jgi:DNA-directed RNA polymerase specialized sigma subunit